MPDDRPNVLFLFSDEHSFRGFGHREAAAGGEPVETPTLDGLARSGTRFTDAYCAMPLCTPSRLCTLTGREVRNAGAWANEHHLKDGLETLPGTLSEAGYETCLVGKMHLGGDRQFGGFDHRPYGDLTGQTGHQDDPPTPGLGKGMEMRSRTADAGVTAIRESMLQERTVLEETVAWLREHRHRRDRPWFLTASFSRPHFPLTAPRRHFERYWDTEADEPTDRLTRPAVGFEGDTTDHPMTVGAREGFRTAEIGDTEGQRARAAYFACIDYLDEILGDLLATLEREGFLENTVVVYASDHGELAGEHGLWWKHTWHEAAARVPFIIETPAQRGGDTGHVVEEPVSLTDLFPTVCGLAGVETPDVDGVDLSESVRTGVDPGRGPVFCDNLIDRWGPGTEFRMVRSGRYKYVAFRDAPEILIDLEADPAESENLADGAEGPDREALERLRGVVADTMDFEAAAEERARDERALEERTLAVPDEIRNSYHLPDGTVVDADTPLYRPHIITENPAAAFDDYPD